MMPPEYGGGKEDDAIGVAGASPRIQYHRKCHGKLGQKAPDVGVAFFLVALIHRQDLEAGVLVPVHCSDQRGEFFPAGRTPGRPEGHHDRVAAKLRQPNPLPLQRLEIDFRGAPAGGHVLGVDCIGHQPKRQSPYCPTHHAQGH